ncbi:MAG: TetR/AcrR family transcriptional regulator [Candidatus Eisenbacteria bacterium]|uniref:TetR/AcrR family transcriptional regulator n=1 Tax=Eiseniibacteriota bacterium TaxID=2212470 RepID=A0A956RRB1_UNCEI|nr:TetR/AcrR family transcriptional regulator [Candidatus Eisenbacteria bacterium]
MSRSPTPSPSRIRRARVREQTQTALLESAARAFRVGPYDSVSMEAVAAAAGYSKRSVYLYFADKQALFEAVLRAELAQWSDSMDRAGGTQEEPLEQLRAILIESLEYLDRRPALLRHLLEYGALVAGRPEGTTPIEGDPVFEDWIRTVTRCLDRAVLDGSIPIEADPQREAAWIWQQILGVSFGRVIRTNRSSPAPAQPKASSASAASERTGINAETIRRILQGVGT